MYLGAMLLVGGFVGFFVWLGWLAGKSAERDIRRDMTEAALLEMKELKEHEAKLYSGPGRTLADVVKRVRNSRRD